MHKFPNSTYHSRIGKVTHFGKSCKITATTVIFENHTFHWFLVAFPTATAPNLNKTYTLRGHSKTMRILDGKILVMKVKVSLVPKTDQPTKIILDWGRGE